VVRFELVGFVEVIYPSALVVARGELFIAIWPIIPSYLALGKAVPSVQLVGLKLVEPG
jgi:hypothetical protein